MNVKVFATEVEAVKFRNEVVPKRPSDGAVLGTWKHRDGQCEVVQIVPWISGSIRLTQGLVDFSEYENVK